MKTPPLFLTLSGIIACLFFVSSCTFYDGSVTGNAALAEANYRYVGNVSASNKCVYVFHIGGNSKEAQITELKDNLRKRYPLRDGLAWANVSLEMKSGFYILFDVRKAVLSADIVDFWPDTNSAYAAYNGYYLNKSTFIPVPATANFATVRRDSLYNRLTLAAARKNNMENIQLKSLEFDQTRVNTEVVIYIANQPVRGIIFKKDFDTVYIAYLDRYGEVAYTMRRFGLYLTDQP